MSILIKGMEMPSCNDCPLAGDFKCNLMPSIPALCKEYDIAVQNGKRLNNCPLIEIPPHGRLIDADKLKEEFPHDEDWNYPVNTNSYVVETIDQAPIIIGSEGKDD